MGSRARAWRPRLWAATVLLVATAMMARQAAAELADFPESVAYNCESSKCVYASDASAAAYADGLSCMKACGDSDLQSVDEGSQLSDIPSMTVASSLNGTCTNCSFVVETSWNFPQMLDAYDLTADSLAKSSCNFTCEAEINMPALWLLIGSASTCHVGSSATAADCSRDGNTTTISMDADALAALMTMQNSYSFTVDHVTTRLSPGTFSEETTFNMKFDGTGCRASNNSTSDTRQVFDLELTSDSYELVGMFSNTSMTASNSEILSSTDVTMSFRSGAVLSAGAFILLRVASDVEPRFGELIANVSTATMALDTDGDGTAEVVDMELYVGAANISFTIPDTYEGTIQNGDEINITFSSLSNAANSSVAIEKGYLSAYVVTELETGNSTYVGVSPAVDNSVISFYELTDGTIVVSPGNALARSSH